ncbi:MAG: 2-hydroxyacyl-CoA dehydratase subunit D [Planctomycetota bacterium]|jgi:benzoyl-CoA reductase/2-hydroxyglutaryl-CoA dehydratase subunit BcrC/BadD/HgdB
MTGVETLKKDIEGWIARFLVKQVCYFGPFFLPKKSDADLEAMTYLKKISHDYYYQLYKNENRVVWTSLFVPSEIIFGMGLLPFSLEIGAALFACGGFSQKGLMEADSRGIPLDVCSFHKSALGFAYKKYHPRPIIHAATTSLCDSNLKMIKLCEPITGKKTAVLDVPYELNGDSVRYLASQLENLVKRLEEVSGRKMDQDRFRETIETANNTRRRMLELNDTRVSPFSNLRGMKALGFMLPSYMLSGSKMAEDFYTMLSQELKKTVREKELAGAEPEKKIRLLWLELKPYFKSDMPKNIEESGDAKIVFEEANYVYWDELDPKRPYESLARKLISNHNNGPLERRLKVIKKLVKKYDVEGVVVFSQWGCRRNNAAVPIIKKELARQGIPLLNIDGDCVDNHNVMAGQISTRFEGFMEMLRAGRHEQKEVLKA